MSPLYTYNQQLLQTDGSLASGKDCCCTEPPTESPTPTETPTQGACSAPSPYDPNDPCYQQVIAIDPFCCVVRWDYLCQNAYNECQNQ